MFQAYLYEIFLPRARAGLKAARTPRMALVKALSDAGAPLLLGTDTTASGYNVHQELALLVESGLTPYQALTAATRNRRATSSAWASSGPSSRAAARTWCSSTRTRSADIANARGIAGVMLRGDWWAQAAHRTGTRIASGRVRARRGDPEEAGPERALIAALYDRKPGSAGVWPVARDNGSDRRCRT